MARYIRTKDGVYEVKKVEILCGVKFYDYETREDFVNRIREEQIINQSENLEELCDLFIDEETKTIFHKHNGYVINWKTNMVYSLKEVAKHFHSVKGAIYTDKGLIYVAKMNEKGELELL